MNSQILPILLSPLGNVSAQAPGVSSAGLAFLLVLIVVNVIGPFVIMPTVAYIAARSSRDSQTIFISTVTGMAIGTLTVLLWWELFHGGRWTYFPSIDEWYSVVFIPIILTWPNIIAIIITIVVVRKIVCRVLKPKNRSSGGG